MLIRQIRVIRGLLLVSTMAAKRTVTMAHFKLSVITDEITQDFGHAVEVAAREFGLGYVELRELWGKNLMKLDAKEVGEARRLLERSRLRVSSIASPIFKIDWPGAPVSRFSPKRDQFGADFNFSQQTELLDRALELTRAFNTDRIRIFDFWRLEDQKPYRAAIDQKLIEAAARAGKRGVTLLLENEQSCNTATGAEAARTLSAVQSSNFMLNWDPGNAAARGETPFPDGYALLPKHRIGYMHCKDVVRQPDGKTEWAAMGRGIVDYVGQFRALRKDGYRGVLSLETHWRGGGTPEECSRVSMAGMKDLLRRAESR
ncbi:MAG TPA: sugar phosphate isomerase/epimerase family protein [Blastocatellia bacterium]|nr:sugar phosphate isomerase/epimerase family protein [Blastocatellia bacterium]